MLHIQTMRVRVTAQLNQAVQQTTQRVNRQSKRFLVMQIIMPRTATVQVAQLIPAQNIHTAQRAQPQSPAVTAEPRNVP